MKKLVNFRLILFIALSLCLGISTAYFFLIKNLFWAVTIPSIFFVSILLYAFLFSDKTNRKVSLVFSAIFLVVFLIGGLSFDIRINSYRSNNLNDHYYFIKGKIESIRETEYGSYAVVSNAEVYGNVEKELDYKIALYVYGDNILDVGDRVEFYALLLDKDLFYEGRFSAYDVERNVKYTATVNASDIGIRDNSPNIFQRVRLKIRETLSIGLDEEEFSIAYAMMTGEDEYIPPETLSSYRYAGVAHIFAVSGLHVGFVATALGWLFTKLRMKRLVKAVVITLILIFYSGVCGFSASSIRATVMSAVLLFSSVRGHKYDKYVSISLSAIIVLLISPMQLFCAGFQLSFMIVLGMFLLSNPMRKLLRFLPYKISSSLGAVLSAQLVGFPICLALFGEFSTIAIIANLLFIPLVGAVFIFLFVCTIFGGLLGIETIALFLPNLILKGINYLITAFDLQTFMVGGFTMGGFIVFYYLAVIVSSGFINVKGVLRYTIAGMFIVFCVLGSVFTTLNQYNRSTAIVCGDKTVCATLIDTPRNTALIVSGAEYNFSTSRLKRLQRYVKDNCIEALFLMGDDIDANRFLTVMNGTFSFKNVYYFGERDFSMEIAVLKSFPSMQIFAISDGERLNFYGDEYFYSLSGNLISANVNGTKIGVFSCFGDDSVDYANGISKYDLLIAEDMAESIFALYNPTEKIVYRKRSGQKDAQINGNVEFLLG